MPMVAEPPGVGSRIRELREAAGMTQHALAVAAGLHVSIVTQLEQGTATDPRLSTLLKLANALGVGVERLTAGLGIELPEPRRRPKRKGKDN